jgi:hypothetical protein
MLVNVVMLMLMLISNNTRMAGFALTDFKWRDTEGSLPGAGN